MDQLKMECNWERPDSVLFPNVWNKFTIQDKDGQTHKIRIQDIPPDRFDDIWDMYEKHFYTDEDLMASANVIEDKESMLSQKWVFYQFVKSGVSIMAVIDNEDPKPIIVGGLLLSVVSKEDPPLPTLPGVARAKYRNLFKILNEGINVYEKLYIERCFKDAGLIVKPKYRRLNIGSELFKAMEQMGKTFYIPAAVTIFNNSTSQALGAKLGFHLLNEVKLSDYLDENGKMILPGDNKVVQLCYCKYIK